MCAKKKAKKINKQKLNKIQKQKLNDFLVLTIYNNIKNNHKKLFESYDFSYHTQIYDLKTIIDGCLQFIKISSSWRNFKYKNINYSTLYFHFIKLNKYKIFEETYSMLLNRYLKKKFNKKMKYVYSDTTTVYNKLNSDKVKRNTYNKNKKVIKISLITDSIGIPIDTIIESGNTYDSKILYDQISKFNHDNKYKKSIFLADSGYDSVKLKNELHKIFNTTIIIPNNRNTKNESKKRKLNDNEKIIYKKRIRIEHTNQKIKSYRRLNMIYERKIKNYEQLLFLALCDIIIIEMYKDNVINNKKLKL